MLHYHRVTSSSSSALSPSMRKTGLNAMANSLPLYLMAMLSRASPTSGVLAVLREAATSPGLLYLTRIISKLGAEVYSFSAYLQEIYSSSSLCNWCSHQTQRPFQRTGAFRALAREAPHLLQCLSKWSRSTGCAIQMDRSLMPATLDGQFQYAGPHPT